MNKFSHDAGRRPFTRNAAESLFILLAILWLGLLLGVSFLATPVKFQAGSLSFPTALEVGRVTFALFVRVEWVLLVALILAAWISSSPSAGRWLGIGLIAFGLLLEAIWLLPILDARVTEILDGVEVPASLHHRFYIGVEAVKALALLALGGAGLWKLSRAKETGCR